MKHAKVRTKKAVKKRARPSVGPRTAAAPGTREKELEKLVFLARVNMIELEHQNDELRATEAELESSRQKYVSLFDFSPIAYFGLDLAGIIREANLLAAKILGLERKLLVGKDMIRFVSIDDRREFRLFMNGVLKGSAKQSVTLSMKGKDKSEIHVLLEGMRTEDTAESDKRFQIALIDLTETKRLEEKCKELAEELKKLKSAGR